MNPPDDEVDRDDTDRSIQRLLQRFDAELEQDYPVDRADALEARIRQQIAASGPDTESPTPIADVVSLADATRSRTRRRRTTALGLVAAAVVALIVVGGSWLKGIGDDNSSNIGPAATAPPGRPPTTATSSPAVDIDVSAVRGDPRLPAVTSVFDTYFGGINRHDATAALSVYVANLGGQIDKNDPASVGAFARSISTTTDGGVAILSMTQNGEVLDVRIAFTSTQAAEFGPNGQTCTHWDALYHLVADGAGYQILAQSAQPRAC